MLLIPYTLHRDLCRKSLSITPLIMMDQESLPTPLQYPQLDSSTAEIRLLRIHPNTVDAPVQCSFQIINLDHQLGESYETLSYSWQNAPATETIHIGLSQIKVSLTLLDAIKRLRNNSEVRVLWADALCINQDDKEEKSQQVGLMGRVYSQCKQVAVWLGSTGTIPPDTARTVIETLTCMATRPDDKPSWVEDPAQHKSIADGLKAFMNAPWWKRIWTVQEIMLPKSATLHWGALEISWEHLDRAVDALMDGELCYCMPRDFCRNGSLDDLSSAVRGLRYSRTEDILNLLVRWRYRGATVPHDKIYGLMGLRGDLLLPSVPSCDYTLDLATMYTRITVDLINEYGCLLPLVGRRVGCSTIPGLPSWAIDWTWGSSEWFIHRAIYEHLGFTADRGLAGVGDGVRLIDEKILVLRGILVDRIAAVEEWNSDARSEEPRSSFLSSGRRRWERLVAEYQAWLTTQSPGQGMDDNWSEALEGVIAGNLIPDNVDLTYDTCDWIPDKSDWLTDIISKQRLFITDRGYFGVGPINTECEQEVWCIGGSRFPLILESLPPQHDNQDRRGEAVDRRYIGDAFVYGIMTGDVMPGVDEHADIRLH